MAVWGKITPLREIFHNSSIKVQQSTPIDVFLPGFHAYLSRYKEKRAHCTRYKNTHTFLSPPFCTPLAQGAKISIREI